LPAFQLRLRDAAGRRSRSEKREERNRHETYNR
jgi:hypothetical protein